MTPNGGGAKAGLQPGDRIVTIKGKQVEGSTGEKRVRHARKLLSRLDTGTPIRIGYVRDGKPASAEVTPQIDQNVYVRSEEKNTELQSPIRSSSSGFSLI